MHDAEEMAKAACQKWIDVRAFGQVFPFKGSKAERVKVFL